MKCKNCSSDKVGAYCSNCGQKTYEERFTLKSFFYVFLDAFNVEKGFFYTLKLLFISPGRVINEYLGGRTRKYYNPLKYYVIIAGIGAFLVVGLDIYDINYKNTREFLGAGASSSDFSFKVSEFLKKYMNLLSILIVPFFSLVSKWYYKREKLNYAEHLILICFFGAQTSLIGIVVYPFFLLIPVLYDYYMLLSFVIFTGYVTYALKQTFKRSFIHSFFGGLTIYIVGQILFLISFFTLVALVFLVLFLSGVNLESILSQK